MTEPGDSYDYPINYLDYKIYRTNPHVPHIYAHIHNDYDGAPGSKDDRYGFAATIATCKFAIDQMEAMKELEDDPE